MKKVIVFVALLLISTACLAEDIYTKASDTAIKYSRDVVLEVKNIKEQREFLVQQIAALQSRLTKVDTQLSEAAKLGVVEAVKSNIEE